MKKGMLFIVSGPSGAGKSTLSQSSVEFFEDMGFSVSYTTRAPRAGEINGVDYNFVDDTRFDAMVKSNEFLEYAAVHGKKYGTAAKDLEELLKTSDVILDIDVQGAEQIRAKRKGGVYIFILPPSMKILRERLAKRGISEGDMEKRFKNAVDEIKKSERYDYIIINDELEESEESLKAIIRAERIKTGRLKDRIKASFEF
ncbi:MAG: guanylate kinase [Thermodesulfobacteriota bacterium]